MDEANVPGMIMGIFGVHIKCVGNSLDGSDGKESAFNTGDVGSIPGLERSPGEGNANPVQWEFLVG